MSKEQQLLDVIGAAVKRKQAKHCRHWRAGEHEEPAHDFDWWVGLFFDSQDLCERSTARFEWRHELR